MTTLILLLSLVGLVNAFYLYYQHQREKKTGQKMFCLIGGDCSSVVGSKYGRTLGIKNEKIGMTYYALLIIYIFVLWFVPQLHANTLLPLVKIIAGCSAFFSFYLFYIQTMVLKKICSWCLIEIAVTVSLFGLLIMI